MLLRVVLIITVRVSPTPLLPLDGLRTNHHSATQSSSPDRVGVPVQEVGDRLVHRSHPTSHP